jgi:hypothetical protein
MTSLNSNSALDASIVDAIKKAGDPLVKAILYDVAKQTEEQKAKFMDQFMRNR